MRPVLVEDLDISVRTYNCLKAAQVHTVEQLDLIQRHLLGRKLWIELKRELTKVRRMKKEATIEQHVTSTVRVAE